MPLIEGASAISAKSNYGVLIEDGYPPKQAFAIMASIVRRNINKVSPERRREIMDRNFFGRN